MKVIPPPSGDGGVFENVGRVELLSQHLGGCTCPLMHRTALDSEVLGAIASLLGDTGGEEGPEVWVLAPAFS